MKESINRLLKQ